MLFSLRKQSSSTGKSTVSTLAVKKSNPFSMSLFKKAKKKPLHKLQNTKQDYSHVKSPSSDLQKTIARNQILYAQLLSNKMYRLKSDY